MDQTDVVGPIYRGRQTTLIVVSVIFTFIGAVAIVLRIIGRFTVVRGLGADDWLMTVGMVLTGAYLGEILYGLKFGMGLHTADDSSADMVELLKLVYAIQLTYNTIVTVVKASIVYFYLRLAAVDTVLRTASHGTLIFLGLFYISAQITTVLHCLPIHSNWDITGTVEQKCINNIVFFYAIAIINILIDLWIFFLPIRTLMGIKRPRRDKIVLFVLFGLGGFSTLSSIIRLYTIRVFEVSTDPFFDAVPINMWSMIEINVAIFCASVPAMKPLFKKSIRNRFANSRGTVYRIDSRNHNHQMVPLSNDSRHKNTTHVQSWPENRDIFSQRDRTKRWESDEEIMPKSGGIELERGFSVEEEYVDTHSVAKSGDGFGSV